MAKTMTGQQPHRRRKTKLVLLLAAASLSVVFLTAGYTSEEKTVDPGAAVSLFVAATYCAPATPLEMALKLEEELAAGAGILMPDPDRPVRLSGGVIPLDETSRGFPADFLAGLVPEKTDGVDVWRATLRADDTTGDMIFYNADGKAFWAVTADVSVYSADWVARLHSVDGESGNFFETAQVLEELSEKPFLPRRLTKRSTGPHG
jgi:hypothetical protein